jgi:hypothetical protein
MRSCRMQKRDAVDSSRVVSRSQKTSGFWTDSKLLSSREEAEVIRSPNFGSTMREMEMTCGISVGDAFDGLEKALRMNWLRDVTIHA